MTEQPPTTETPRPSISEMLHSIIEEEDLDQAFLIAGAFNLYLDAMRKRGNRHLVGPEDVQNILRICRLLLAAGDVEQEIGKIFGKPTRRSVDERIALES
jgi:hypothetical protein